MSTHTSLDGARWPSVASRSQRFAWIAKILEEDNIDVAGTQAEDLAASLLKDVYSNDLCDKRLRMVAFESYINLEKAIQETDE